MADKRDIVILGGGPGGYVAALRAAQLKKKVILVEADRVGGTCMNYGCIPTKYLLHQTKLYRELKENKKFEGPLDQVRCNWKAVQSGKSGVVERLVKGVEFLLNRNGVELVRGEGRLRSERQVVVRTDAGEVTLEAEKIILATGSRAADLPFLKADGKAVVTSTEALEFETPPQSLLVVGAGAIGLELGTVYSRLGTDVTVLEILPTILPGSDREMVTRLERLLKRQGLKIFTEMKIETAEVGKDKVTLKGTCLKTDSPFEYTSDRVLLAAGRKPNSEGLHEGTPFVSLGKAGWVGVNPHLETNIPGIYAIGDLIGGKLLAHKASHEGIVAAENASGGKRVMEYNALPMAVFTEPEFASVGMTEEEARENGINVRVGMFSLQANGRALTLESPEGMVKVIAAGEDDRIIGAHLLAPGASELIGELTLAIHKGLKLQDVSSSIHIHPTLSEAVMESALKALNIPLHTL